MSPSPSSTPPPPSPDSPNVQQADSHPPPPTRRLPHICRPCPVHNAVHPIHPAEDRTSKTCPDPNSGIHRLHPPTCLFFFLFITHTSDSHTNTIRRISCFSHLSSQLDEARLTDRRQSDNMGGRWGNSDTIPHVACGPPSVSDSHDPTAVPGWLFRRVAHTLSATTAWCHPCCWPTACHISLCDRSRCLINSSPHACVQWTDGASSLLHQPAIHPSLPHVWIWAPAS